MSSGRRLLLLDAALAGQLGEEALRGTAAKFDLEPLVERRGAERRQAADRRGALERPAEDERRRLRSSVGRRLGERRGKERQAAIPPQLLREIGGATGLVVVHSKPVAPREIRDREETRDILGLEAGDEALEVLDDHYFDDLRRFFFAGIRDYEQAKDLARETLMSAHESFGSWRFQGTQYRVWLFRVARNRMVDHLRRAKPEPAHRGKLREARAEIPEGMQIDPSLDLAKLGGLGNDDLGFALSRLTACQRQLLFLHLSLGYTAAQAGEIVGETEANAEKTIERGLNRLAAAIGADPPDRRTRRSGTLTRIRPAPVMAARRFALWRSPSPSSRARRHWSREPLHAGGELK